MATQVEPSGVNAPSDHSTPDSGSPARVAARRRRRSSGSSALAWGLRIGLQPLGDNSLFTHIATGRIIFDTGFPHTDPYLFTPHEPSWVVQSWLASVIYWALASAWGMGGAGGVQRGPHRPPGGAHRAAGPSRRRVRRPPRAGHPRARCGRERMGRTPPDDRARPLGRDADRRRGRPRPSMAGAGDVRVGQHPRVLSARPRRSGAAVGRSAPRWRLWPRRVAMPEVGAGRNGGERPQPLRAEAAALPDLDAPAQRRPAHDPRVAGTDTTTRSGRSSSSSRSRSPSSCSSAGPPGVSHCRSSCSCRRRCTAPATSWSRAWSSPRRWRRASRVSAT